MSKGTRKPLPSDEFYEPYSSFAKTVRAWLIAFGIGAPVLFLSNRDVLSTLKSAGLLRSVMLMFLGGVAFQVVLGLIYRTAMWYLHVEERGNITKESWRYRISSAISDRYWPEIVADLSTLALFGLATLKIVDALCS